MKKNFYLILLIASSILVISCHAELEESNLNSSSSEDLLTFEEYFDLMGSYKPEGTILIQSNRNMDNQDNESNIYIDQKGSPSKEYTFYKDGKAMSIVGRTDQSANAELFGNILEYNYDGESGELYIPTMIKGYVNPSIYSENLSDNTPITWNSDKRNTNGVVMWITYKPTNQPNLSIADQNNKYITHGKVLPDTGSYTITEDDIEMFPDSSKVDINLLRYAYKIEDSKPSILSFSTVSKELRIIK